MSQFHREFTYLLPYLTRMVTPGWRVDGWGSILLLARFCTRWATRLSDCHCGARNAPTLVLLSHVKVLFNSLFLEKEEKNKGKKGKSR